MKNIVGQLEKYMPPAPAKSLKSDAGKLIEPRGVLDGTGLFTAEPRMQGYERVMQSCVRRFKAEKPRVTAEIPEYKVTVVSRGTYMGEELQDLMSMPESERSNYCGNLQMAWMALCEKFAKFNEHNRDVGANGRLGACILEKTALVVMRGRMDAPTMRELEKIVSVKERYLEKSRITEYVLSAK